MNRFRQRVPSALYLFSVTCYQDSLGMRIRKEKLRERFSTGCKLCHESYRGCISYMCFIDINGTSTHLFLQWWKLIHSSSFVSIVGVVFTICIMHIIGNKFYFPFYHSATQHYNMLLWTTVDNFSFNHWGLFCIVYMLFHLIVWFVFQNV